MAILGIETGAFGEGGDSGDGRLVQPRVFLESPCHARDTNQISINGFFDFLGAIQNGAGLLAYGNRNNGQPTYDGNHVLLTDSGFRYTLGKGWQSMGQGVGWIAPWGTDLSFSAIYSEIMVSGKYSGSCGLVYQQSGQDAVQYMGGSCSFQIISADLTQTVDITPPNCGIAQQGLVPVTFDSVALFGRKTSFWPQLKMTSFPTIWVQPPQYFDGTSFGPRITCAISP